MAHATSPTKTTGGFMQYTRGGGSDIELPYEKPVVVPAADNNDPVAHAWADARFWTEIMAEHATFFALLMPPETCAPERKQALEFAESFSKLHRDMTAAGPPEGDLKSFSARVSEQLKPYIDYKARLGEAQTTGKLRSLVWPLFFDHTRHEAERFMRRMNLLAAGESEFDKEEVAEFWTNIMEEHARFVAHLLDP